MRSVVLSCNAASLGRIAAESSTHSTSNGGNGSFPPPGFNAEQAKKPLPSSINQGLHGQQNSTINQRIQVKAVNEKAKHGASSSTKNTVAPKSESSESGNGSAAASKGVSTSSSQQTSSLTNVTAKKSEDGEKKRLTIGQKIKKEAQHYWDGTKLLATEVRISTKLVVKMLLGYELSRRENRQLRRTIVDLGRLVPFSAFVIIPFAELLLPVALKLFPNLLPSTYEGKSEKDKKSQVLRNTRKEVSSFLHDTLGETGLPVSVITAKKEEFTTFFHKIRNSGESPSHDDVIKVCKIFKDDLTLDNLSRSQLVAICRYMNLNTFGTDALLRYSIRHRMRQIKRDDKAIYLEGVDSLSVPELQMACASRGIRTHGIPPSAQRDELATWLDLRLVKGVPSTLLVLSNAYSYNTRNTADGDYTSQIDGLKSVLSSIPEELFHEIELEVHNAEGAATNKQRLEVLKEQEELIEEEREQSEAGGAEGAKVVKDHENLDEEEAAQIRDAEKAESEAKEAEMEGEKAEEKEKAEEEKREKDAETESKDKNEKSEKKGIAHDYSRGEIGCIDLEISSKMSLPCRKSGGISSSIGAFSAYLRARGRPHICHYHQLSTKTQSSSETIINIDASRLDPDPTDYHLSQFTDKCSITIRAGSGGNGCVSFLREKFVYDGPANGGNGGTGGNIFIQAVEGQTSLHKLARRRILKAGNGKHGQGKSKGGTRGDDVLVTVPVGTIIREVARTDPVEEATLRYRFLVGRHGKLRGAQAFSEDRNRWVTYPGAQPSDFYQMDLPVLPPPRRSAIAAMEPPAPLYLDLSRPMEKPMLLLSGAVGGLGNPAFITTTNPKPMLATKGEGGTSVDLELELKMLADVGLVGLPNAGKSTLLRSLTNSRTRIGNWAFTTLSPNIGTYVIDSHKGRPEIESKLRRQRFTIADIPGLIQGAHLNRGLGLGFLRHVERAGVLAFVIDLSAGDAVIALKGLWNELNKYQKIREKEINLETENRLYSSWDAVRSMNTSYEDFSDFDPDLDLGESGKVIHPPGLEADPTKGMLEPTLPPMYSKPWLVIGTKADIEGTQENFRTLRNYLQAVERNEVPHPCGEENAWRGKLYSVPVSAMNAQGIRTVPEKIPFIASALHVFGVGMPSTAQPAAAANNVRPESRDIYRDCAKLWAMKVDLTAAERLFQDHIRHVKLMGKRPKRFDITFSALWGADIMMRPYGTVFASARQICSNRAVNGTLWRRFRSTVPDNDGKLPLKGLRVLDMSRVLAGPYCSQILGDLGAEVIKVEHPTRGDDTRAFGPPYAPYKNGKKGPGESAYYLAVNRNKKSIGINFQHPSGVEILHSLAKQSDVLIENYVPGTLKKYNMDYSTISIVNPRLIYASITGYGQTGPYSNRAGYDVMVEAEMGLMHVTGPRNGPPVKVGVAVTDLTTGLYCSNSILAALLARQVTGRGQHVDVALSDCQVATLSNLASSALISGNKDSGRWGTSHPSIVPYCGYKTKDSDILIGGANDKHFGVLCDRLGFPEWKTDEQFVTNADRVKNREILDEMIGNVLKQKTTQEWLDILEGSGMAYAAINDIQGTLNHAHVQARGMVAEVEHPDCGTLKMVNTPVKFSHATPGIRSPPPTLGQNTTEILSEVLDYEDTRITQLKSDGIVA
ncbi:hypothetical protein KEM54_002234 [Ascosphaera aggregata]|nr:hypothetical protein KEM54_002234 [Ascosphaera aggregata]